MWPPSEKNKQVKGLNYLQPSMCLLFFKGSKDTEEFAVVNIIILLFTASFMPEEHVFLL